jgi:hypothetical protein
MRNLTLGLLFALTLVLASPAAAGGPSVVVLGAVREYGACHRTERVAIPHQTLWYGIDGPRNPHRSSFLANRALCCA